MQQKITPRELLMRHAPERPSRANMAAKRIATWAEHPDWKNLLTTDELIELLDQADLTPDDLSKPEAIERLERACREVMGLPDGGEDLGEETTAAEVMAAASADLTPLPEPEPVAPGQLSVFPEVVPHVPAAGAAEVVLDTGSEIVTARDTANGTEITREPYIPVDATALPPETPAEPAPAKKGRKGGKGGLVKKGEVTLGSLELEARFRWHGRTAKVVCLATGAVGDSDVGIAYLDGQQEEAWLAMEVMVMPLKLDPPKVTEPTVAGLRPGDYYSPTAYPGNVFRFLRHTKIGGKPAGFALGVAGSFAGQEIEHMGGVPVTILTGEDRERAAALEVAMMEAQKGLADPSKFEIPAGPGCCPDCRETIAGCVCEKPPSDAVEVVEGDRVVTDGGQVGTIIGADDTGAMMKTDGDGDLVFIHDAKAASEPRPPIDMTKEPAGQVHNNTAAAAEPAPVATMTPIAEPPAGKSLDLPLPEGPSKPLFTPIEPKPAAAPPAGKPSPAEIIRKLWERVRQLEDTCQDQAGRIDELERELAQARATEVPEEVLGYLEALEERAHA